MNKDFNDYKEFIQASSKCPDALDSLVAEKIGSELNPAHGSIFTKLVLTHGFVGFLTLLFCPQFSLSLTNNHQLFHYFHSHFGEQVCMLICGSIFLGSGALFAISILNKAEIKKIKSSQWLYYTALSIAALSVFMLAGAEVYLGLVFFWLFGACAGGICLFRVGSAIKDYALAA